ncbi:MAG: hypothetical protein AUH43_15950 [Acidobacteria bacterium 13_1_40CM_65_14]|nr:MAG: hypothetical protein AUH43_15950 [Acidobacteria bacterium 13_1_40CM_65_14]OLD16744.1 MAG: hypothetical protein AUJ01_10055 [Acidobacteria bacterium 13_1_40CM_3_65_5]
MRTLFRIAGLLAALAVALPASAQFGHPLKGTWSGDWGPNKQERKRVLLDINWDGKALTGAINPGPNAVTLQKATLDPSNWSVHFEAESKDAAGKPIRYVIDGKLENIGAYQRVITGTWTEGAKKGDFKVVRN